MRKQSIGALGIFKLYYKVLSQYKSGDSAYFISIKATKISDLSVENAINGFLSQHRFTFDDSVKQIEDYFNFCFSNNFPIYFFNLDNFIEEWKKHKLTDVKSELKYLFAEKIRAYLQENNLSFKEYISPQKRYIPKILQHYITSKEIPFEIIIYMRILDKCDIDKRKLKILLHREFVKMKEYEERLKKLKPLIDSELKKVVDI